MLGEVGRARVGRLARLVKIACLVVLVGLVGVLGPEVLAGLDRSKVRAWVSAFLQGVMVLEVAVLGLVAPAVVGLGWLWKRARREGRSGRVYLGGLAAVLASVAGVGVLELGAWVWTTAGDGSGPSVGSRLFLPLLRLPQDLPAKDPRELRVLVLGGSTAEGFPFAPSLSVGQVVAWKLQEVFPGRRVVYEPVAESGETLRDQLRRLAGLRKRPDLVLVYSGHNEFQSRFPLMRVVDYYPEDRVERPKRLHERLAGLTPLLGWLHRLVEKQEVGVEPMVLRSLVDRPVCTEEEYRVVRETFREDLERLARYCEELGAVLVMLEPTGNQSGCGPNRSVLPASTEGPERLAFATRARAAIGLMESDPERAEEEFRALVEEEPGFAESHWRLGRLLLRRGRDEEAAREFDRACDLDGLPVRCPGDFREAYEEVGREHGAVVIDSGEVIRRLDPRGQLGDRQFLDIHHPGLPAYLLLSQAVLDALDARGALGWPEGRPAPRVGPDECARHFGLGQARWREVARAGWTYNYHFANLRYDRLGREGRARVMERAAERIEAGVAPERAGAEGLGVHPAGLRTLEEARLGPETADRPGRPTRPGHEARASRGSDRGQAGAPTDSGIGVAGVRRRTPARWAEAFQPGSGDGHQPPGTANRQNRLAHPDRVPLSILALRGCQSGMPPEPERRQAAALHRGCHNRVGHPPDRLFGTSSDRGLAIGGPTGY